MKAPLRLIVLDQVPIFKQLQMEEALLRLDTQNWCLLNQGSPPSIVMGISGNPHESLNQEKMKAAPLPLIQRYSGGGTVVVDPNTLFVSFIFQKTAHPFSCFPESIFRWTEIFYKEAFDIPYFQLIENDYTIGELKCGGNAQYIQKERFAHHTTFLWDYDPYLMDYLAFPKKVPAYRSKRPHSEFLCRLQSFLSSKDQFFRQISETLSKRFTLLPTSSDDISPLLNQPHRKTTRLVNEL